MTAAVQQVITNPSRFSFDAEFQKSLIRIMVEEDGLYESMGAHIQPEFFESESLAWMWSTCKQHYEQYEAVPSFNVLQHHASKLDVSVKPVYQATVDAVRQASLQDHMWVKDAVLDFVKRNIFTRTFHETRDLYNSGKVEKAYDLMMERMEHIQNTTWEARDESWFFDDLGKREAKRIMADHDGDAIPTGFPWLDHIFDGGFHKGEMGIWIAYPKVGKTSMLLNLGRVATAVAYRNVAHFVFEASRQQVENRYDSSFMAEMYHKVRRGNIDGTKYQQAHRTYTFLKGKLYIRGFTDKWDYSVPDIDATLKDLWRTKGWRPDMVIVDYGDLLTGRDKGKYKSTHENQTAAFRDLKSLANRGYAVWTASQARRPRDIDENKPTLLQSKDVAESYDKVRVADFIGSLNQTPLEQQHNVMRLYAELYRDNAADKWILVQSQLERMYIGPGSDGMTSPSVEAKSDPRFGYRPQQIRVGN